jgi:hypothetical protein
MYPKPHRGWLLPIVIRLNSANSFGLFWSREAEYVKKTAVILGLAFLSVVGSVIWQFAACYVANSELQSDMQDLAVQSPFRIGLTEAATEDELRDAVIAKAKSHGIQLDRQEVIVQRTFTPEVLSVSLAADYKARVNLLVESFTIHFNPSSSHSAEVVVK